MSKDELRDLILEAEAVTKKLKKVWLHFEDEEIRAMTEIKALPCDACEGKIGV